MFSFMEMLLLLVKVWSPRVLGSVDCLIMVVAVQFISSSSKSIFDDANADVC